jgi:hypothetical protein
MWSPAVVCTIELDDASIVMVQAPRTAPTTHRRRGQPVAVSSAPTSAPSATIEESAPYPPAPDRKTYLAALHHAPRLRPRRRKHMVIRSYSGHYHFTIRPVSLGYRLTQPRGNLRQARGAPPVRGQG